MQEHINNSLAAFFAIVAIVGQVYQQFGHGRLFQAQQQQQAQLNAIALATPPQAVQIQPVIVGQGQPQL